MLKKKEENVLIGARIKLARESAGYTQERLAELIDVTAQYISGLERGVVGLSIPVLINICTVLQVSCDTILLGQTALADASQIAARLSCLPAEHIRNVEELLNRYLEGIAIAQKSVKGQSAE